MLTCAKKDQKLTSARFFFYRFHREGDKFFSHIISSDEIWTLYVNVELKQQQQKSNTF